MYVHSNILNFSKILSRICQCRDTVYYVFKVFMIFVDNLSC